MEIIVQKIVSWGQTKLSVCFELAGRLTAFWNTPRTDEFVMEFLRKNEWFDAHSVRSVSRQLSYFVDLSTSSLTLFLPFRGILESEFYLLCLGIW
jgi:hypothetical protein